MFVSSEIGMFGEEDLGRKGVGERRVGCLVVVLDPARLTRDRYKM